MTEGNRYNRSLYTFTKAKKTLCLLHQNNNKKGVIMGYQFFHIETYARVAKSYEKRNNNKKKGVGQGRKK